MRDFRDTRITKGTKIVYVVRHGADVTMKEGVVTRMHCSCGFGEDNWVLSSCSGGRIDRLYVKTPAGKTVKLTALKNIVVVT